MAIDDQYKRSKEAQRDAFEKYFGKKPEEQKRVIESLTKQRERRGTEKADPRMDIAEAASITRLKDIDAARAKASQPSGLPNFSEMSAKDIIQQGLLSAFKVPNLNFLQGVASPIMGRKFLNILESDPYAFGLYDSAGNLTGVRDEYGRLTGRDVEAQRQAMMDSMDRDRPEQEAVPPNPVTGQCPAGYTYDANAQACMPVFTSQVPTAFNYETYTPAPTLLDQPSGLLDVAPMFGQPMDFNYGMPRVRLI